MGYHGGASGLPDVVSGHADAGGASRFFYCAKPSRREKEAGLNGANTHSTVKSITLMRYLTRLVTPPNGTVLDMFAGSGTTLCAAMLEGFNAIGIEREEEYANIARARTEHWLGTVQPDAQTTEDTLPLFTEELIHA
jgi:site-specific DNA-methyltransferase (adenine-specific)